MRPLSQAPVDQHMILAKAAQTIRMDAAAVLAVAEGLDASFCQVLDLLQRCTGKVLVTGMGTSGASARRIAHLLSCGGTPALFVNAADGLHGGLGAVSEQDVVIAASKGGESDELNEFCRRARARGARLVAMTATSSSTLARLADIVLIVQTPSEADPGEMMAMGSALAVCALGDALAITLMELRGYSWEAFEFTHPGGAVGKLIQGQHDDAAVSQQAISTR